MDNSPSVATASKWDRHFLELAKHVSTVSKDPSTKCGAVIVRPDRSIVSTGYNGFPRKMKDKPELYADREAKYARVIHCEMNAILAAREPLNNYRLYVWPFLTCDRCAVHVIQTGISYVVAPIDHDRAREERWRKAFEASRAFYAEAGVIVKEVEL